MYDNDTLTFNIMIYLHLPPVTHYKKESPRKKCFGVPSWCLKFHVFEEQKDTETLLRLTNKKRPNNISL